MDGPRNFSPEGHVLLETSPSVRGRLTKQSEGNTTSSAWPRWRMARLLADTSRAVRMGEPMATLKRFARSREPASLIARFRSGKRMSR